MSMPNSSEEVATTAGSRPAFSSSSTMVRCSRETEPWWARATVIGTPPPCPDWAISWAGGSSGRLIAARPLVGEFVEARGEPFGQPAGVREDDRRAVALDQIEHPLFDVRPDRGPPLGTGRRAGQVTGGLAEGGHVLDRHDHFEIERLGRGRRDDGDGRGPAQERGDLFDRAAPSRTTRCAERGVRAGRRVARATGRGARRAWSRRPRAPRRRSRCRRRASDSRAAEVNSRNSDSGVVIRMSAGRRSNSRRSSAEVSPERIATVTSGSGRPRRTAAWRIPARGERRLRSTSTARALSGLT